MNEKKATCEKLKVNYWYNNHDIMTHFQFRTNEQCNIIIDSIKWAKVQYT